MSNEVTDTVTIPRALFNALCEAAIDCEAELRVHKNGPYLRYRKRYDQAKAVMDRALAIRDELDKSQQIG